MPLTRDARLRGLRTGVQICEPKEPMNPCLLSDPADCDPHPQYEEINWHLLKNHEPYPGGTVRISS